MLSVGNNQNNDRPPNFGRRRGGNNNNNQSMMDMDAPPGFGRNRRQNQMNQSVNNINNIRNESNNNVNDKPPGFGRRRNRMNQTFSSFNSNNPYQNNLNNQNKANKSFNDLNNANMNNSHFGMNSNSKQRYSNNNQSMMQRNNFNAFNNRNNKNSNFGNNANRNHSHDNFSNNRQNNRHSNTTINWNRGINNQPSSSISANECGRSKIEQNDFQDANTYFAQKAPNNRNNQNRAINSRHNAPNQNRFNKAMQNTGNNINQRNNFDPNSNHQYNNNFNRNYNEQNNNSNHQMHRKPPPDNNSRNRRNFNNNSNQNFQRSNQQNSFNHNQRVNNIPNTAQNQSNFNRNDGSNNASIIQKNPQKSFNQSYHINNRPNTDQNQSYFNQNNRSNNISIIQNNPQNSFNQNNHSNYNQSSNIRNKYSSIYNNQNNKNQQNEYKSPPPSKPPRQQQKQAQLQQFMQSVPFSDNVQNEALPDSTAVHRHMKKFNTVRLQKGLPLMDEEASKIWVYPSNLQIRKYQFETVKASLFSNQLVCLPTGMGKTLIAAIVMYNFYRWYPRGIIIFACPTRALVEQQMKACYDFMDIQQSNFCDLTGQSSPKQRAIKWKQHKIFFASPQSLKSDLSRMTVPIKKIVCMVIDEAHKAQKEHSFRTMTRDLMAQNSEIRILALTATPAENAERMQSLIDNIHISNYYLRYENDPDIKRYRFETKVDIVGCPLSASYRELRDTLIKWINHELQQLFRFEAIRGFEAENIAPWQVFTEMSAWTERIQRDKNKPAMRNNMFCLGKFMCLHKLVTLRQLLEQYSMGHMLKKLTDIIEDISGKHGHSHTNKLLKSNEFNEWKLLCEQENSPQGTLHPKLKKLGEILEEHFENTQYSDSRVIVFSSFRYSVLDIVDTLSLEKFPHCKPYHFVGQSSGKSGRGLSAKEQQEVIGKFKKGTYNILVSTCVGEEGLDIGQVDIVINYDIPQKVLRNVQRNGRTGRKRKGRVVYLWTTAIEKQRYNRSCSGKKAIESIDKRKLSFFGNPPRMFPTEYNPSLLKMSLKPPAEFIGLSARKKRRIGGGVSAKCLYQPPIKGINDGLLTLTQNVAFMHKFEIKEDDGMKNRMNEIIGDAIENTYHLQSEYAICDEVKPSVSTKFMVKTFRKLEDEQEWSLDYNILFPKRKKNIYDWMNFGEGDDEFMSDPLADLYRNNDSKEERVKYAQEMLSEDEEVIVKTPSPKRKKRKRKNLKEQMAKRKEEMTQMRYSDEDSSDCEILKTKKKKKKSPKKKDSKKKKTPKSDRKKKKKKRKLDEIESADDESSKKKRKKRKIDKESSKKSSSSSAKKKKKTKKKRKEMDVDSEDQAIATKKIKRKRKKQKEESVDVDVDSESDVIMKKKKMMNSEDELIVKMKDKQKNASFHSSNEPIIKKNVSKRAKSMEIDSECDLIVKTRKKKKNFLYGSELENDQGSSQATEIMDFSNLPASNSSNQPIIKQTNANDHDVEKNMDFDDNRIENDYVNDMYPMDDNSEDPMHDINHGVCSGVLDMNYDQSVVKESDDLQAPLIEWFKANHDKENEVGHSVVDDIAIDFKGDVNDLKNAISVLSQKGYIYNTFGDNYALMSQFNPTQYQHQHEEVIENEKKKDKPMLSGFSFPSDDDGGNDQEIKEEEDIMRSDFSTRDGVIIHNKSRNDDKNTRFKAIKESADESVLFNCPESPIECVENDQMDETYESNKVDIAGAGKNVNKEMKFEFDENEFIAQYDKAKREEKLKQRIRIKYPKLDNDPWSLLSESERKEVETYLDTIEYRFWMDPSKEFEDHIAASKAIIRFMKNKTDQMESFWKNKDQWPFDEELCRKLGKIHRQMNEQDIALAKYSKQCSNLIDGKLEYVEPNNAASQRYRNISFETDDDSLKRNKNQIKLNSGSPEQINEEPNIEAMKTNSEKCRPPHEESHSNDEDNDDKHTPKRKKHKRTFTFGSHRKNDKSSESKEDKSPNSSSNSNSKHDSTYSMNLQFSNHSIDSPLKLKSDDEQNDQSNIGSQFQNPNLSKKAKSGAFLDLTQEQCSNKPIITEKNDNLIKCPLCDLLFDTPQAIGVHIDNDHHDKNEPSPNKSIIQSQPTPILPRKRKRNKQNLILTAETPPSSSPKSNKKRKISSISSESEEETPAIAHRRRKKRKIMPNFSDDEQNS